MKWKGLLAGVGFVLVTAAACGQPAGNVQPGAGGGQATPPASDTSTLPVKPGAQQPPQGSKALPATQLDVTKLPADYPHEVFVTADGKALYFRAEEGGCGRAAAEVAQQDAQQVVVNVTEHQSAQKGQMCTMDIRYPLISVPLADPLGSRKVILVNVKQNR